jgi:hypothetical protein
MREDNQSHVLVGDFVEFPAHLAFDTHEVFVLAEDFHGFSLYFQSFVVVLSCCEIERLWIVITQSPTL